MADYLTVPKRGEGPTLKNADEAAKLIKYVNALLSMEVSPTGGGRLEVSESNIKLILNSGVLGGSGGTADVVPFDVINASDEGGYKVRVRRGVINSVAPVGMSPGDSPPFILPVADGDLIVAQVSVSYDSATNLWGVSSVSISAMASVPDADSANAYVELGSVSITDGVISVQSNKMGTLQHYRCGNDTAFGDLFLQ